MSSRGRVVIWSVTLALLIGLGGACGGSSKSYTAERSAAQAKATAAAQKKLAAERRRLAAAQQRARALAARKAAFAARLKALAAERARQRAAASTSTTTTPTTGPPSSTPTTTPTTTGPAPATNVASDLAAIQATLGRLNAAFHSGVAAGIAMSETVNYRVVTGLYTAGQCAAFEAARGGGVVAESLAVHTGSFRADPGWVDPVAGLRPVGRIYAFVVDDTQTLVPTGEQRHVSFATHATVRPDGHALLFLSCA